MIKNITILKASKIRKYDPTRTTSLRNAFVRDLNKRFRALRGIIRKAIIEQDCFGMWDNEFKVTTLAASDFSLPGRKAFAFPRSEEKVTAFMAWLQGQEAKGILQVGTMQQIGQSIETAWTNKYIKDSYQRGIIRARMEMKGAGYNVPPISETGGIAASMSVPFHMDRAGVLFSRTFQGLKGITSQMDTQISRVLAQGIADGENPMELAKLLTRTISGPVGDLGITDTLGRFIPAERRAQMLARTEIIRAHNQANIQEMKNWAVEGVKVQSEWVTAGYNVCPECQALEGKVYSLDEMMNKIPLHPNCRCVAIPVKELSGERVGKTVEDIPTVRGHLDSMNKSEALIQIQSDIGVKREKAESMYDSLVRYSGKDDYQAIRNGKMELHFNNIEDYIKASPKWGDTGPLLRGITVDSTSPLLEFKKGAVIDMKGISSWTSSEERVKVYTQSYYGDKESILFSLESGSFNGVSIKAFSKYAYEDEVLLSTDAGKSLKVFKISQRVFEKDGKEWTVKVYHLMEEK